MIITNAHRDMMQILVSWGMTLVISIFKIKTQEWRLDNLIGLSPILIFSSLRDLVIAKPMPSHQQRPLDPNSKAIQRQRSRRRKRRIQMDLRHPRSGSHYALPKTVIL